MAMTRAGQPIMWRLVVKLYYPPKEERTTSYGAYYPASPGFHDEMVRGPYVSEAACNNQASFIRNGWRKDFVVDTYNEWCVPEWSRSTR